MGKCAVLPSLAWKLGTTDPWLLQCIRDPIPTQLCCGTSKLGGARLTRMKESHEVYEIRQGTSVERPLCCGRSQRYVLRRELHSRLFVCHRYSNGSTRRQRRHQRLQD